MTDSDLLLRMDNLFLQQICRMIAAGYGNAPNDDLPVSFATPFPDFQREFLPTSSTRFEANDNKGATPPPAVNGSPLTRDGGTLTESELQIVSTLNQHKDKMPIDVSNINEKINDPSTPPDLKLALEGLQKDRHLFFAIGSRGKKGLAQLFCRIDAQDLWDFADSHKQVTDLGGKNAEFNPRKIIGDTPPPSAEGSTVTWDGGMLTESQLEIVNILNQHRDMMPIEFAKLDEKINDPATPPDLKEALKGLQRDPGLFFAIASQGRGNNHLDDQGKCDGTLIAANLYDFADRHPQVTAMGGKNATYNPEKMKGSDLPPPVEGSSVRWDRGMLNQNELEIVTTLDRHKDKLPMAWADLDAKIDDPATPPDLKKALTELQNDPRLFFAIGSQGDGKCDGDIKADDLSKFSASHWQVAVYATQQAKNYTQNYVASDSPDNTQPTVMTENDAMREFYRYSDYLPGCLNQDAFKQLVEGDSNTQKCPPQVIAAAQYFRDHPDQWKELAGDSGSISTPDFLQKSVSQIHLTESELKTLDTINGHQDAFFDKVKHTGLLPKKVMTRDKLAAIVKDDKADPAVRDAAKQLLGDPLLFGFLNNSITGYKVEHTFFGDGPTIDSGNISNYDFKNFYERMSAANRTAEKAPTHAATAPEQKKAFVDMVMGKADQPDIKTPKKDKGTINKVLHTILKWGSKILDGISVALSALSFIPVIGEIADAAAIALEAEAQALQVLDAVVQGDDVKLAWERVGINMAGAVAGVVGGPSARLTAKVLAKRFAKSIVKEGVKSVVNGGPGSQPESQPRGGGQ